VGLGGYGFRTLRSVETLLPDHAVETGLPDKPLQG